MNLNNNKKTREINRNKWISLLICDLQLDPRAILSGGDPRDRIIKAAEDLNVDGIIVGYRGMSFLKRKWMGSVSNYIIKNCKCPVIVIKNDPEFFRRKSITNDTQ
jgi:hypothetical protein